MLYKSEQMKVPHKLQKTIKELYSHGDVAEIARRYEFSRYRVSRVIDGEDDSDPDVIAAVAEFYTERKDTISDYLIAE